MGFTGCNYSVKIRQEWAVGRRIAAQQPILSVFHAVEEEMVGGGYLWM
jgi:hypothetical protein